jgi:uncharacterized coiled-coil DUF342 family protein
MKNLGTLILGGIVAGCLMTPALSSADTKNHNWQRNESRAVYHGRGTDSHQRYDTHNYRRGTDYNQKHNSHNYRRDSYHDNRGHHNKPEIRRDFKGIRNARNEVKQDRREVRGDYKELRKDRGELRRDVRNHASKDEIVKDRQELRDDYAEIKKDRTELRHDQGTVQSARNELNTDLRKR